MRPYRNIKLTEYPDVGDIRSEGRRSAIGRIHSDRGYCRPVAKAVVRRALKKADRRISTRELGE
jgi:hypothetical protein